MGTSEEHATPKAAKAATSQETPPPPPPTSYPDWSSSMQAYYGTGTAPPFFASPVASPAPHGYMWGGQHPMMAPYGTPVHYPAMYPPGALYAPPTVGTAVNTPSSADAEGKFSNVKDHSKKSKRNSGVGNDKAAESARATSGSGNDGASQSAESGSEGSSDASDEDHNQQDSSMNKKGSFGQMLVDAVNAKNNGADPSTQISVPGEPVVSIPATALNIGMDLWNGSPASAVNMRPNSSISPSMPENQFMDERELKRQKRKLSNRESARRSRLRKQAECEELQHRVEALSNENSSLREEMTRLATECQKLSSENGSIKEELVRVYGPQAVAGVDGNDPSGEGNS